MYVKGVLCAAGLCLIVSGFWFVILSELHHTPQNSWFDSMPIATWAHWPFQMNYTNNFIFGQRILGDRLIFMDHAKQAGKFLQVVSTDVYYPLPSQLKHGDLITCIRIIDQKIDGTGGVARIVAGGIGFPFVYIHLSSRRSYGFDFLVEIYGS